MNLNSNRREKRKVVRKICGPVMENNIQRIRYNEEINTLMKTSSHREYDGWDMSKEWKIMQCRREC
jgi:ribosomal protein S28E/S33